MSSTALDYITIRGFKSIASLEKLPLRSINILIGSNGSGKSNFIGVFAFLHAIRQGRLRDYVIEGGGAEKVLHFGSKTTKKIYIHLSFRQEVNQYELELTPTQDDGLYPSDETVFYWDKSRYKQPYGEGLMSRSQGREAGISDPQLERIPKWVRLRLGGWRLYHVHDTSSASPMRKTAKVDDNRFLRPDGSNLAAFLYYLDQEHPTSYRLIQKTVQRVAPFFDDFKLSPSKLKPDDIKLEWTHKNSDQYFDASSLSDGTLRFVALATLFLQPKAYLPSVILVDEPELGLHPYAIEMLASLIRHASETTQDESVSARIMGNARLRRRRGGIRPWPSARRDIINHLREDAGCVATTMVDFYGLPQEGVGAWPGRAEPTGCKFHRKPHLLSNR